MKNHYKIKGDITEIYIKTRDNQLYKTIIDTEDLPKLNDLSPIHIRNTNSYHVYAQMCIKAKNTSNGYTTRGLHRIITNAPQNLMVDHINHDTLDNIKCNLRLVDNTINQLNRKGATTKSKSKIRGVHFCERDKRWIAQLRFNKKAVLNKRFSTKEQAKIAFDKALLIVEQLNKRCYEGVMK